MTDKQQLSYFRRRLTEEHDLAKTASCDEARAVHEKMASIYASRLTLSYLDQANNYKDHKNSRIDD